ncbi:MAG: hypothetical protein ACFFD4_19705 [Candidatus Odinarchaeota archaeon]
MVTNNGEVDEGSTSDSIKSKVLKLLESGTRSLDEVLGQLGLPGLHPGATVDSTEKFTLKRDRIFKVLFKMECSNEIECRLVATSKGITHSCTIRQKDQDRGSRYR